MFSCLLWRWVARIPFVFFAFFLLHPVFLPIPFFFFFSFFFFLLLFAFLPSCLFSSWNWQTIFRHRTHCALKPPRSIGTMFGVVLFVRFQVTDIRTFSPTSYHSPSHVTSHISHLTLSLIFTSFPIPRFVFVFIPSGKQNKNAKMVK